MKLVEILLEIFGWLIIVFSITAISALIALCIYLKWTTNAGVLTAVVIIFIGFTAGAICATRIWRRHGTIEWLSSIRRIS